MLALVAGAFGCGSSDAPRSAAAPVAPTTGTPPDGMHDVRVVARAEPRQRARFALLRTRPEGLPPHTRRLLGPPLFGMSYALAQRIPVVLAGRYWLVPGNRHLCVVEEGSMGSPGAGSTCARTGDATAHGLADITVKRGEPGGSGSPARLIVGVAPDGAREVIVHTRGAVRAVPVAAGTFVLRDAIVAPPDRFEAR